MFCKNSKDLICSVCLCKKPKFSNEVLPLKCAEEYLRKENKGNKEEARMALNDIENAWKVVNRNRQVFEEEIEKQTNQITTFYGSLMEELRKMEANSIRLCT